MLPLLAFFLFCFFSGLRISLTTCLYAVLNQKQTNHFLSECKVSHNTRMTVSWILIRSFCGQLIHLIIQKKYGRYELMKICLLWKRKVSSFSKCLRGRRCGSAYGAAAKTQTGFTLFFFFFKLLSFLAFHAQWAFEFEWPVHSICVICPSAADRAD